MPNRLIREGFLDSEAIHALSDAAECFFHRLMLTADDAGRVDGRVAILRARLFPLDTSRRASDVEKSLSECVSQGLVIPYEWKGQRFLQLAKWQRCSPCVTSKHPWKDGTFRISYVKTETRDGVKDFVATSLYMEKPSVRDADGIEPVIPPIYGDGDGDGDEINTPSAGADSGSPKKQAKPKTQSVPYDDVVSAYHEALPMLPQVRKLTEPRRRKLKARWLEDKDRQCIEYWRQFFAYVAKSDFLTGRNNAWTGCDFEWLIESSNHIKVIEGKYENREYQP